MISSCTHAKYLHKLNVVHTHKMYRYLRIVDTIHAIFVLPEKFNLRGEQKHISH